MARILFIDIETFPLISYTWGVYDQNVIAVKEHQLICGYSAKWLGGEHVTRMLPDTKSLTDDRQLVKEIWKLFDEADIVCAHNGDRFDIRKINTRFIKHGFNPPSPYRTIDTLKVARKTFGFATNKLDDLCQFLGLGRKIQTTGFDLWQRCMDNDPEAWQTMRVYNSYDVILLEKLYFKLQPWMKTHPSVANKPDDCPKCGSDKLQSRGTIKTATRTYKRFQCTDCSGWSRAVKSTSSTSQTNA